MHKNSCISDKQGTEQNCSCINNKKRTEHKEATIVVSILKKRTERKFAHIVA